MSGTLLLDLKRYLKFLTNQLGGGLKGSPLFYFMTAQEFIKGCEHDGSYVPVSEVLRLMNEFAKLMCDRQKEICAKQALVKQEYINHNKEIITNAMQIYNIEKYDSYYYDVEIYPDHSSILNAPYPDEIH